MKLIKLSCVDTVSVCEDVVNGIVLLNCAPIVTKILINPPSYILQYLNIQCNARQYR